MKETEHFFFKLSDCADYLKAWTSGETNGRAHLQPEALNKMNEWLKDGELADWDISRDAPYFGFEIPDEPNKYFYVWLDAPVGYMASFQNLCERNGLNFDDFSEKTVKPSCIILLAKIFCISTLYFGQPCWNTLDTAPQTVFSRTAF